MLQICSKRKKRDVKANTRVLILYSSYENTIVMIPPVILFFFVYFIIQYVALCNTVKKFV